MRTALLILIIFCSCSQNQNQQSNNDILINKTWKTYSYTSNGTADPVVVASQPTFQFRSDNKMYFSQINPVYRDTLNFVFINDNNIKLTKPWVSATSQGNLKIDRLTENDFDFTLTDNQTSDIDVYKTTKQ